MKAIVCGTRHGVPETFAFRCLDLLKPTKVITGGGRGVDKTAKKWAMVNKVVYDEWPADWDSLGKKAGPLRNQEMADEAGADVLIAFPGGRGTRNMIQCARDAGMPVFCVLGKERVRYD